MQPVDLMQQLFTRYEQPMYRIAYSILHHPQQAEDAVSETFLKVLEHLDQVQDVNSSKTKQFLVSITRNTAINLYRRNQREWEQSMGMEDLPTELADPHMQVYDFEQRDAVAAMLRGLSPEQQEILILRCYEEFSFREIGAILGIRPAAARKRYERAKQAVLAKKGEYTYETAESF